jgi:FtsP/CotA-like multicopper oxidase with cupredoxin domain
MKNGRFNKERFAVFDTKDEFEASVKRGYQPPYVLNRRMPSELPQPQWFTVNGKCYPTTPNLYIKEGESIRVRLINAGQVEHSLHLHGHDFWLVCDDGLPIPQPWQMNTVRLNPGKTLDIIIEGKNRGIWTFHDHDTSRVTNNGLYPGGNLMALVYEDMPAEEAQTGPMAQKMGLKSLPMVALDE